MTSKTKTNVKENQAATKKFHLGDVLSITTGRLVSTRHIGGVYDILNFMTGDNLFTHQLPRASRECALILLEQHPQLKEINADLVDKDNWKEWLGEQVKLYGEELTVSPLKTGAYEYIDPIFEIMAMKPDAKIIPVVVA